MNRRAAGNGACLKLILAARCVETPQASQFLPLIVEWGHQVLRKPGLWGQKKPNPKGNQEIK